MRRIVTQRTPADRISCCPSGADEPVAQPSSIRIVLSHPTHDGNVGAVARAMKNMGLDALYLVAPLADPGSPEARARAAGAEDVLEGARVLATLPEALADSGLVIGSSARTREIPWPTVSPRVAAREAVRAARRAPVALVFGQERMGLTNEELDRCHLMVSIPTSPDFSSLNLAAAVQILAYEVLLARNLEPGVAVRPAGPVLASHEDLQRLYSHLETVLGDIGFFGSRHPEKLMRRLVRLFNRAQLDDSEVSILRGILTAMQQSRQAGPDKIARS